MKLKIWLFIGAMSAFCLGCQEEELEEEEATSSSMSGQRFPDASAIGLTGLGNSTGSSLRLDEEAECDVSEVNGIFGLPLGGACHTAPLAGNLLLGENYNTDFSCDDYVDTDEDDYGLLIHLLCNPYLQAKTTTLGFEDDGAIGISFEKFGSSDAVGHWNPGGADSYPANIRIWSSEDSEFENLENFVAIDLETVDEGSVYLSSFPGLETEMSFKIDFENVSDATECSTAPSATTCHSQTVQIYAGEGVVTNGPPNGFNLNIFADSKTSPEFLMLEGRYRYTEEYATASFGAFGLGDVRSIYFQVIQNTEQVYGKFEFLDSNGDRVTISGAPDFMNSLAAGVCSTLGDSDDGFDTCSIEASDYDNVWVGLDDFENITETPVSGIDWATGKPTAVGISVE